MSNAAKQGAPRDLALVAACAHPVAIGAALLIFANDFVLRRVSPGWWSGKLSDVGWLVVTPILLAAGLSLFRVPQHRAREVALATSIAVYLAMQLWPPLGAWFNPRHIADVEDLVVLPAVGLALVAWRRRETAASRTSLAVVVPFLGAALVATTPYPATPSQSWPCGVGMRWETDVPLRFRLVSPTQNIDSDAFVRGVRLLDAAGNLIPVVVAFAEREPRYAVCPRDGLRPNSAYTLQLGPWTGQDSNEAAVSEDALPKVYFVTSDASGVAVATANECSERAGQLSSEEYASCDPPTEQGSGDTGMSEMGAEDTGDGESGTPETGDDSGNVDSGDDGGEPPPDSGEDTADRAQP